MAEVESISPEEIRADDIPEQPVKKTHAHRVQAQEEKPLFPFDQIVWYVMGVVQVLIAIRLVFKMLGANKVGFVDFVYSVTDPLAVPFYGIFNVSTNGKYVIEWSTIVAMVVYFLIALGIVKLIAIIHPKEI